jgi:hypothetical protein
LSLKLSGNRSNGVLQTLSSAPKPPPINPLAHPKLSPQSARFKFTKRTLNPISSP